MDTIKIIFYTTKTGRKPFAEWLEDLDSVARATIKSRLDRVSIGSFGDCKAIKGGAGVHELRIHHSPGYRIYYGMKNGVIVILLIGGDKRSQDRDIEKAKRYWLECKELL